MNLKRLLCLLLAALMLVGVLAACGGDPKETESDAATTAPAEEGTSGDETGEEPATTPDDPKTEEPGTDAVTPDTDETEEPVESGEPATETEAPKTETPSSSGGTTAKPP